MRRFLLLLRNEFLFVRTAIPVHIVAILQPTLMYLLMATILVDPTFPMNIAQPESQTGWELVDAMRVVGSPVGKPYIEVNLLDGDAGHENLRQVVTIEDRDGIPTAVQHFGLIDNNIVKNYRNRLTAAALRLWNASLGNRAVTIVAHPWLPRDVAYKVYFGMALLPMAAATAASITGGILTAQDFEKGTILQYRLSPASTALVLGARITRLALTGFAGAGALLVAVGLVTGRWPATVWKVALILLPIGAITGGMGITAGLITRKTIPSFLVALVTSFIGWIVGNSFGLAAGFGGGYQLVSRISPNSYAVELLFPQYFGASVGNPGVSILVLSSITLGMILLTMWLYTRKVKIQE